MAQHVFSGSGAPATTPTAIGQHYVDTTNGNSYLSVGTTSSSDWKLAGASGSGSSAIAIGTSIISGLTGSILFIGDGLAQDNANLFYDDAANRFIAQSIRTNDSLQFKGLGNTNLVNISAPTLAAGYSLILPIDDGTPSQVLTTDGSGVLSWTTPSGGSGSSMISIGISVQTGTSGSILFVGNGLAQAVGQLYWDDVNFRLGVGVTAPLSGVHSTMTIRSNSGFRLQDNSGGTLTVTIRGASIASSFTLTIPYNDGEDGQILTSNGGTGILAWGGHAMSFFGDGSDGSTTISSNVTNVGNKYFDDLTIGQSIIYNTGGYATYVRGVLDLNGIIRNVPNDAGVGNGTAAAAQGVYGGGSAGGNGSTTNGFPGATLANSLGGGGGSGGDGGSGTGGLGGAGVSPVTASGGPNPFRATPYFGMFNTVFSTNARYSAGTGGGGGAGNGSSLGGGGGGGAGVVFVGAQRIMSSQGSGLLDVHGAAGGSPGVDRGGGGGGGGGCILLMTAGNGNLNGVTYNIDGGAGGVSGGGTGTNGATGAMGTMIHFAMGLDT